MFPVLAAMACFFFVFCFPVPFLHSTLVLSVFLLHSQYRNYTSIFLCVSERDIGSQEGRERESPGQAETGERGDQVGISSVSFGALLLQIFQKQYSLD